MLLNNCSNMPKEFLNKEIIMPYKLLNNCEVPYIPNDMSCTDSILLNKQLLHSLEECNNDKKIIKKIIEKDIRI